MTNKVYCVRYPFLSLVLLASNPLNEFKDLYTWYYLCNLKSIAIALTKPSHPLSLFEPRFARI